MKNYNRRSIRLKEYDYSSAGSYYITICVQNRICLFGEIIKTEVELNNAGLMVYNQWLKLPERFPNIKLYEFIFMPNHFHGIIILNGMDESPIHPNNESTIITKTGEHKVRPNNNNNNEIRPKGTEDGQLDE